MILLRNYTNKTRKHLTYNQHLTSLYCCLPVSGACILYIENSQRSNQEPPDELTIDIFWSDRIAYEEKGK